MEQKADVTRKQLHELKSGLTAVMGYIQLGQNLLDKENPEETEKVDAMLKKAYEAAESLEKKIRELEGVNEPLMSL